MNKKIIVDGMSCKHCVASVTEALEKIGGSDINIDLETKEVKASFEDVSNEKIEAAIEDIGFDVVEIQ